MVRKHVISVTVATATGLGLGLGLGYAPSARAAAPVPPLSSAACAPYDPQAVPLIKLSQTIDQLLLSVSWCERSAPWLAALGHLLNRQQRYVEAADHLERALMLEPDLQAGQLDYALALAGQGDTAAATAIVKDLLNSATLPQPLRPVLQSQLVAWAAPVSTAGSPESSSAALRTSPWQWGGGASVRLGADSNLLAAPDLQSLTLTFAGQSQTLPLDEGYRPQAGAYQQADLQLLLRRVPTAAQDSTWDLAIGLRSRTSAAAAAGADQYDLTAERSTHRRLTTAPALGSQHGSYINAAVYGLNNQTGTQIQVYGLGAGWGYLRATELQLCEARLGPELQDRSYASNPLLSGRYYGLAANWGCNQRQSQAASPSPNPATQWQLSFKAGRDTAQQPTRAGGDQTQASMRLLVRVPAAALMPVVVPTFLPKLLPQLLPTQPATLLADVEVSTTQDSGPYSPLLESGAARNLSRASLRLEYQQPLPKNAGLAAQWVLGLDWAQQQSNLPLFGLQSRGIYSTLRVAW